MIAPAIEATMPPTIVQPAIASAERLKPRELDIRLEPLPPALTAHGALGGIREHGGDLGTPQPRLLLARHRDVLRHAPPERAVANVDRGEDRETDQRENRDDHEDHQPRRRDDVVDPGRLERALRREIERRASCTWPYAGARPATFTRTTAFCWGGSSERYVSSYSLESCCPMSLKIGCSAAGVAGLDVGAARALREASSRSPGRTVGS